MNTTIIETPDAKALEGEHSGLLTQAKSVKVTSIIEHRGAKEILKALVLRRRAITDRLAPIIESAHKAHKGLTSLKADLLKPIEDAESFVSRECDGYEEAERRKAEEEQKRLEEQARRAEEERRLNEAVQAEKEGDKAAAEEILAAPIETPIVEVAPRLAKVEGESARATYGCEVLDLMALVKHVVAHPEDLALLMPNGPALNARARSQREGFKLPGCRLKKDIARSFRKVE